MSRRRQRATLSRRGFLRGVGGIALSLPWLEQLHGVAAAQSSGGGPRRVITVAYPMGIAGGEWRPSNEGTGFTLPYTTAPLAPFQDRCLFVSTIDNRMLEAGGQAFPFGHPAKKEACLTGTLTTGAFPTTNTNHVSEIRSDAEPTGGANGPSVDHVIGEFYRQNHAFPSINLGVDGAAARFPAGSTQNSDFFFEGRGNAVTMDVFPSTAFDKYFADVQVDDNGPSDADLAMQRLRARNRSVLDAVRESFTDLSRGLGRDDRMRLEEHASRIRQLELDVRISEGCTIPTGIDNSVTSYQGVSMDGLAPLHNRILAHTMACDLAPVGRLEYLNQQNPRFGLAELDSTLDAAGDYDWHGMVHGDALPGTSAFLRPGRGAETGYDGRLLDGYRFFVQQFADLLSELDSIQEGPDTTVLDNSLVILASDLGEGLGHGHMKMGYIVAGNLGGARTGYHFDAGPNQPYEIGGGYFYADSAYNVNQLLNSILDMAGVTDESGAPVTIGLGGYLEQVGRPRRIDGLFG